MCTLKCKSRSHNHLARLGDVVTPSVCDASSGEKDDPVLNLMSGGLDESSLLCEVADCLSSFSSPSATPTAGAVSAQSIADMENTDNELFMENIRLRQEVNRLREQWEVAINRSIANDLRLMELTDKEMSSCGVQTECVATELLMVSACVQTDDEARVSNKHHDESPILLREMTIRCLNENNNKLMNEIEVLEAKQEEINAAFGELQRKYADLLQQFHELRKIGTMQENYQKDKERNLEGQLLPRVNGNSKGKLILRSDSHGRGLTFMLQDIFPQFSVSSYINPGAPYETILNSVRFSKEVQLMNYNDWLILVGGTNSVGSNFCEEDMIKYIDGLVDIINNTCHTNLILTTIPYRYDLLEKSHENLWIKKLNRVIRCACDKYSIKYVDLWTFERSKHTRQGLHLNQWGKINLLKKIKFEINREKESGRQIRLEGACGVPPYQDATLVTLDATSINVNNVDNVLDIKKITEADTEKISIEITDCITGGGCRNVEPFTMNDSLN